MADHWTPSLQKQDFSPNEDSTMSFEGMLYFPPKTTNVGLKGHSELWDRTDLDTSFLTLKRVHPNLKSKQI